jgi:hypothetical protein
MGESAEVADRIAAILPPRWSPARVTDFMEQFYALHNSNVAELAALAKHPKDNPYPVSTESNHADMLLCGAHPWLYARKVSELTVRKLDSGYEHVSWVEPDRYGMKPDKSGVELAHKGKPDSVTRMVRGALSTEMVWDRSTAKRKAEFVAPAG